MTLPSQFIPGVFVVKPGLYAGGISLRAHPATYFYDKDVVILMDLSTMSFAETSVMVLRNGPNVTVMGQNSIGANGNRAILPLPGISMRFTGLGMYTPDGGQTQRIGLSPDIYVERTLEGIREGRDELMDAAVAYLTARASQLSR